MIVVLSNGMELRVSFKHFTPKENVKGEQGTECTVTIMQGEQEVSSVTEKAIVHPKDMFSREKGRLVSLKKVLEKHSEDKDIRAEVWNAYNTWKVPYGSLTRVNKALHMPEDELVETVENTAI